MASNFVERDPEEPEAAEAVVWRHLLMSLTHVLATSRERRQRGIRLRLAMLDRVMRELEKFEEKRYGLPPTGARIAARAEPIGALVAEERRKYETGATQRDWERAVLFHQLKQHVPWGTIADVILNVDGLDPTIPAHHNLLGSTGPLALRNVRALRNDCCTVDGRAPPGDLLRAYVMRGSGPRRWTEDGRAQLQEAVRAAVKAEGRRGGGFSPSQA